MTDALPISRFPVPDLANMPEDIKNRILAVQEKSGIYPLLHQLPLRTHRIESLQQQRPL